MKRCWFGLGLLVVLLVLGLLVTGAMTRNHEDLAARLDTAAVAAEMEDWTEAARAFHDAREGWEKGWHFTAAFADHEPMEEIDGLFAQAEIYLRGQNPESLAAACIQLARMTEAMGEAHALNWWNLL